MTRGKPECRHVYKRGARWNVLRCDKCGHETSEAVDDSELGVREPRGTASPSALSLFDSFVAEVGVGGPGTSSRDAHDAARTAIARLTESPSQTDHSAQADASARETGDARSREEGQ